MRKEIDVMLIESGVVQIEKEVKIEEFIVEVEILTKNLEQLGREKKELEEDIVKMIEQREKQEQSYRDRILEFIRENSDIMVVILVSFDESMKVLINQVEEKNKEIIELMEILRKVEEKVIELDKQCEKVENKLLQFQKEKEFMEEKILSFDVFLFEFLKLNEDLNQKVKEIQEMFSFSQQYL